MTFFTSRPLQNEPSDKSTVQSGGRVWEGVIWGKGMGGGNLGEGYGRGNSSHRVQTSGLVTPDLLSLALDMISTRLRLRASGQCRTLCQYLCR